MQCIIVKTHHDGQGNSRLSATAAAGRVYVQWDPRLDHDQNHDNAALIAAKRWHWYGRLAPGTTKQGDTVYCFIQPYKRPQPKTLKVVR